MDLQLKKTGFKYEFPTVGETEIRGQLNHAVAEGWFPKGLF